MNVWRRKASELGATAGSVRMRTSRQDQEVTNSRMNVKAIMGLALWFGLATGLGEGAFRAVQKFGFGQMLRTPIQFAGAFVA